MATLSSVNPQEVHVLWPTVYPFLEEAISRSRGRYTEATVFRDCATGTYTLWLVTEGALIGVLVTQIVTWPSGLREGMFVLAGGENHKAWMPLMEIIEGWALANRCSLMNATGRPGWERALNDMPGWEKTSVELVKCLAAQA